MIKLIPLITVLTVTSSWVAHAQSIQELAPKKLQSHFVFDGSEEEIDGLIKVKGFELYTNKTPEGDRDGFNYRKAPLVVGELHPEVFEFEKEISKSVLHANFEVYKTIEEKQPNGTMRPVTVTYEGNGSAVVVGKNLVLTNHHVIDVIKTGEYLEQCPGGKMSVGFNKKLTVKCQEIILCGELPKKIYENGKVAYHESNMGDWCLLRTSPLDDGREIGDVVPSLSLQSKLSKVTAKLKVATIGNLAGLGIQFSWGKINNFIYNPSFKSVGDRELEATAMSTHGNSGGALVSSEGNLIGLVYGGGIEKFDESASIRIDYIVRELKKQLAPEVLNELEIIESNQENTRKNFLKKLKFW